MSDDALMTSYVDPEKLRADVDINLADLTTAMQKHASLYVYYATQTVRAKRQWERYKAAFEILEAKLDGEHRTILKEEDPKGATEAKIRAAVVQDTRWKAANSRVIEAQQIYRLAEVAERAFEHRKDMLKQIAQDAAREKEGQLRVVSNQAAKERFLEAAQRNQQATGT